MKKETECWLNAAEDDLGVIHGISQKELSFDVVVPNEMTCRIFSDGRLPP